MGLASPSRAMCCSRRASLLALAAFLASSAAWEGLSQEAAKTGTGFELTDHNGKPFSSAQLHGLPYALFFGFTNCPDVCPTTLLGLSNALARLGSEAERLKILFVTVDPERDTPERLRAYLASFDPHIIGLTGDPAAIAAVAKAWKASYYKLPEADGSYTVTHSAYVYLMDRHNRQVGTLGFQESEAEQVAKLRRLLAGAGGK